MTMQTPQTPADLNQPIVPTSVQAARLGCGIAALLAVPPGLMFLLSVVFFLFRPVFFGEDYASSPSWIDYADIAIAVVLWCIVGCLGAAALWLGGARARAAWTAGLVGAGLMSMAGVAMALAPLSDPHRSTAGGWGQPWMPEVLVGAAILAVSGPLLWLLLRPTTGHWASPPVT